MATGTTEIILGFGWYFRETSLRVWEAVNEWYEWQAWDSAKGKSLTLLQDAFRRLDVAPL